MRHYTVTILLAGCLAAISPFLTGCESASPARGQNAAPKLAAATASKEAAEWSYTGRTAPDHWGELDPSFNPCSTGKSQSPIDIEAVVPAKLPPVTFHYHPSLPKIEHNGHCLEVVYSPGNSLVLNGTEYQLLQFHFHHPSEHVIHNMRYAMEIHLVHKSADGRSLALGLFVKEGAYNRSLEAIWKNMPTHPREERASKVLFDLSRILPANHRSFRYTGSVTTPPCPEGVQWIIMTTPITMSRDQIAKFESIYSRNIRPLQALNSRKVFVDSSARA